VRVRRRRRFKRFIGAVLACVSLGPSKLAVAADCNVGGLDVRAENANEEKP